MGNKKDIEDNLKAMNDALKGVLPDLTGMADKMKSYMHEVTPDTQKNVKINDLPAVMQLYQNGKVSIVFGTVQEAKKYYDSEATIRTKRKKFWFF